MKVLHVLYSGLGGHGNVFFSMVNADDAGQFEFEALFNGVEDVKADYIERCREKNIKWSFVMKIPGFDPGYYRKLYKIIKASRPNIIFLHGGAAALPARLVKLTSAGKCRIIVRETQANHLKARVDWTYLAMAMLVADKMVYLSEEYKQQVKAKLNWLYREKDSVVIPNGIDLNIYKPGNLDHGTGKIIIGMQSRLIAIKDHLTLLDAFKLLQQQHAGALQLQIAGDGEYKETITSHAKAICIADDVVFTGMLEEPGLVEFLQRLDIYIHASLGETMSTAIMQAMACGKAIIASDVPGINNMIQHEVTGLLVPAKDPTALAASVTRLINNPEIAAKLAANALSFAAKNYSNRKMLENYKAIF